MTISLTINWRNQKIRDVKSERKGSQLRINDEIDAPKVRLISADGEQRTIVSIAEALRAASDAEMDLVEIAAKSEPPVCRIMDYGKYQFEQSKQRAAAKKNQKRIQVKEVKLRPGTDIGDYNIKLRNLRKFIEAGNKAKVTLRFRGREMAHQELGVEMMKRVKADLDELATVESEPALEGRQMVMVLAPKKK